LFLKENIARIIVNLKNASIGRGNMTVAIELIKQIPEKELNEWIKAVNSKMSLGQWFGTVYLIKRHNKDLLICDINSVGLTVLMFAGFINWFRNYLARALVTASLKKHFKLEKHYIKEYSYEELVRELLQQ